MVYGIETQMENNYSILYNNAQTDNIQRFS